jgi:hypothetical protein
MLCLLSLRGEEKMTATQKFIEEVETRLKVATPGPWVVTNCNVFAFSRPLPSMQLIAECKNIGASEDSALIAHAPTDLAKAIAAIKIAVQELCDFRLGHEHKPDLPHTRALGETYGWCDHCNTSVSWGPGDAEIALSQIEEVLK